MELHCGSDADYTESSSNQEVSEMHNLVTQMYKLFQLQLLQKVVATAHQLLHTQHQAITTAHSSSVRLSNGNTAGSVGSYAAAQMAARTGVSASTWEHIIARESNGQLHARNASGAAGLFQTMPG